MFQAIDYHDVLAEDKLELDFKFCNRIEDDFHEMNDWVVQESILGQLRHDMVRVDELHHNNAFQ